MSPLGRSPDHDRARELAALRIDEPLEPAAAAWLEAHLAGCAPCADAARSYAADRTLFAALRDTPPVPPRDLWARTAAAIDADSRGRRAAGPVRRFGAPLASLVPLAGVGVAAVVVATVLLNQGAGPGPIGPAPGATAIAVDPGDIAVVTRDADGQLRILTAGVDEVCPLVADDCDVAQPSFQTNAVARLGNSDNIDAILSPARDRIVVVQRDPTGADGVYALSVRAAADPTRTPEPTQPGATGEPATESAATPSTETGSPTATAAPTTAGSLPPSEPPASSSLEPSGEPTTEPPTTEPPTTEPPTEAPSQPASPAPTEDATTTPDPTPSVAVTPAPDGTIEIAKDVVVVGGVAAYNADGTRFAFTARPSDGSTGPDVFVWDTDDTRARAVTGDHGSVFAGWDGDDLLLSRVVDGTPRTIAVNPRTGAERGERGEAAWLPTVSPDGASAVWWDGSVRLAADGVTWVPDRGRLVIGSWPGDADAAQVLVRGAITSWEVRWAPDGSAVAAWTAGPRGDEAGRLSLYAMDRESGRARLADPLLRDEPAYDGFSIEDDRLVYAAPTSDGERTLWLFVFGGGSIGKMQLDGEDGATVVR